jgi:uncharacterized membrane protein YbhN (UPF0104 family)
LITGDFLLPLESEKYIRRDSNTGPIIVHDRLDPSRLPPAELASMRRKRSWLRWLVQAVALGLVAVFLTIAVRHALDQLRLSPEVLAWERIRWLPLVLGILLSGGAIFPSGIAWLQTLRDFQTQVAFGQGLYAYFLGHLGKYVPGKTMAILLRVGYLHRLGVPVRPTILSVFIETLTSLISGSILGALFLQTMTAPLWLKACALACIPLAIAMLIPNTFRWLITKISRSRLGSMPEHIAQAIGWKLMVRCTAWSMLGWLMHGSAAWLLLLAIQPDVHLHSVRAWSTCVASSALAALAGFVSLLPGGAGVRELVATWGIATLVPPPVALVSAFVTRLAVIASELVILAALAFWIQVLPEFRRRGESRRENDQDRGI